MNELIAYSYKEIDNEQLEKSLKNNGMVFVRLSARRTNAFIQLHNRSNTIEKYKWNHPGILMRMLNLILAGTSLVKVLIFHMRLIELLTFNTLNDVRCTWELQKEGDYVFIFS